MGTLVERMYAEPEGPRLPTLRTGDDASRVGRNVYTGDRLVVSLELILQSKSLFSPAVELNGRVASDGQRLTIGREGVVGDGVVEKMVNFGRRHGGQIVASELG